MIKYGPASLPRISMGVLGKVRLAIASAALAVAGIAEAAPSPYAEIEVIKSGTGASPTIEDVVLINYKGTLPDGTVFDEGERAVLPLKGIAPGMIFALERMQRGGVYKIKIPAEFALGKAGADGIPPNSDLTFEIELLDFKSRNDPDVVLHMGAP